MADERRALFLAPHYDDVALSCGGTVAALAAAGERPLILTIFGGKPKEPLSAFAQWMHERWGVGASEAVDRRRAEEECAANMLGVAASWLAFLDAIYRGERYTSNEQLFGGVHPDEAGLPNQIAAETHSAIERAGFAPSRVYVPLGIGNHVDHQHVRAAGRALAAGGIDVWAYEDFPYAGDPGWRNRIERLVGEQTTGESATEPLTVAHLDRRIAAVLCYASQHAVIFRHQGDPATATRSYAASIGGGQPAERFWRLTPG